MKLWLRSRDPGLLALCGIIVAFTVYYGSLTLDIHHGLGTAAYDSGLYDQGVWLLSRFRSPFVTTMGRNLLGDHTSFILLLLVPFYWFAPGAWILFWSQAAVIGLGAVPVYLYARETLRSSRIALFFGVAYLVHPAVLGALLENYHPDSFLGLFIPIALWAALSRRWGWYACAVAGALLVKEDVALVIVPLGLWVAARRDRRIGFVTAGAAVLTTVIAMFVVMRSLIGVPTRNAWRIPFGGPSGFLSAVFTRPRDVVSYFTSEGRPWYLVQMMFPMAFQFLRRPGVAVVSALVLFTNVLSTYWYQFHIEYHYSIVAVPALVFGTIWAISHLPSTGWRGRRVALIGVMAATGVSALLWSPIPFGRSFPSYWASDHPVAVAAREAVAEIPDSAVVAAHFRLAPHLAYRDEIYQFPTPFRAVLYGVGLELEGTRLTERAERVEFLVLQRELSQEASDDFAVIEDAFDEYFSNDFWIVWQRDRLTPLPPLP